MKKRKAHEAGKAIVEQMLADKLAIRPAYSHMARTTGIPVSTQFDAFKRLETQVALVPIPLPKCDLDLDLQIRMMDNVKKTMGRGLATLQACKKAKSKKA